MKRILVALTIAMFAASPVTFAQGNSGGSGQGNSSKSQPKIKSGHGTGLDHLGISAEEAEIIGGVTLTAAIVGGAVALSTGGGGGGASGTTGG